MGHIIAIDGPSGTGKSTVSKLLAKKLGYTYIDTGAMYRTAALFSLEAGINLANGRAAAELCKTLSFSFQIKNDEVLVTCNGRDVTDAIRTHDMGMHASDVSKNPMVREALVKLQRDMGKIHNAILEGRDIGTVVFPHADVKFYLNATLEERARRRYKELIKKGERVSLEEVKEAIRKRDLNDSTRETSPLKPAEDAIIIDTTGETISTVIEKLLKHIRKKIS